MLSKLIAQVLINAAPAIQSLQRLAAAGAQSFNQLQTAATRASAAVGRSWVSMTTGAGGLANRVHAVGISFRSMAAAFGTGLGVRALVDASDAFVTLNNRIKAATTSSAEHQKVLGQLRQTSNESGSSIENNSRAFIRFNLAMRSIGGTTSETTTIIDTLNKAFVVNGTTATEARAGLHQLSQAFASGRLNGDEFRSVLENLPFLARKIAEEMNTTVGQLKEFAKEGAIGPEIMRRAFAGLRSQTLRDFSQITRTIGMSLEEMRNEFILWAGEAGQTSNIANKLAEGLSFLAQNIDAVAIAMVGLIGVIGAGALGGALAGIVAGLAALFTIPGAIVAAIVALGSTVAYLTLRTTEADKAAREAAKSTRLHSLALQELDDVIKEVNAGTEGAADKLKELTQFHFDAAKAAVEQAKAEVDLQKALLFKNLEEQHGLEEAQRIIREGDYDSPALKAAFEALSRARIHLEQISKKMAGLGIVTDKTKDSVDGATKSLRVMHGTSVGVQSLVDAHGKVYRVTRQVGEELDKNSKKYKDLQEAQKKALDVISAHEGTTLRITKGVGQELIALIDEAGQVTKYVDLQTGAITELTNSYEGLTDAARKANTTAGEGTVELTEAEKKLQAELAARTHLFNEAEEQGRAARAAAAQDTTATEALDAFLSLVVDGVKALSIAVVDSFKKVYSDIKLTLDGLDKLVYDTFWGAVDTVKDSLNELDAAVRAAIFKAFSYEGYAGLLDWLAGLWNDSIAAIKSKLVEFKDWALNEFKDIGLGMFGGLITAINNVIDTVKTTWNEFTSWWTTEKEIEPPKFPPLTEDPFANIRTKWEEFKTWWEGENTLEAPKIETPSIGDMGPQAGIEVPIAPVSATKSAEVLDPIVQQAPNTGAAAAVALADAFYLNLENQKPSENILDVREFGIDTLIHQFNLAWINIKNNSKASIDIIKGWIGGIFGGGGTAEEGSGKGDFQGGGLADPLINAFMEADIRIRTIVTQLTLFIANQFAAIGPPILTVWATILTLVQEAVAQTQEAVVASFAGILPSIQEAITALQELIADALETLKSASTEAATATGQAILEAFQSAINAVTDAINGLVSTVKSGMSSIVSAVNEAVAAMNRLEAAARAAEAAARSAKAAASGSAAGGPIGAAMARGGRVWGAGTATSDSIWRKLSRGEYVIRAAAVRKYGQLIFDLLNGMALPKGFLQNLGMSMGGMVNNVLPVPGMAAMATAGSDGGPTSALFLELWKGGAVVEARIDSNAVDVLTRHSVGKRMRSLGRLPQGRQ